MKFIKAESADKVEKVTHWKAYVHSTELGMLKVRLYPWLSKSDTMEMSIAEHICKSSQWTKITKIGGILHSNTVAFLTY